MQCVIPNVTFCNKKKFHFIALLHVTWPVRLENPCLNPNIPGTFTNVPTCLYP